MYAVSALSESMSCIATEVTSKKQNLGKVGANLRSVVAEIEEMRPTIEAAAKSASESSAIPSGFNFKKFKSQCEIEARLDALIEKKIRYLVVLKEYHRQYGGGGGRKLIEHRSTATKTIGEKPALKNSAGASNTNDDSKDENDGDGGEYDWPWEYKEYKANQKDKDED